MSTFLADLLSIFSHPYIAIIFLAALVFDFLNGFHDAANAIATIVGTRVLRPFYAVLWAAWWNFAAAWFFGVHVADTVATWVHADYVTTDVIFAGLLGASLWDILTWYLGLPTSSSHALLGGFAGAAIAHAHHWAGVLAVGKVLATIEFISGCAADRSRLGAGLFGGVELELSASITAADRSRLSSGAARLCSHLQLGARDE